MKRFKRIILALLILGLIGLGVTQGLILSTHQRDQSEQSVPVVIILGAKLNGDQPSLALRYRLEKALEYAERHPETTLLCSGGQGPDEQRTEAEAMQAWLIAKGIAAERIMTETASHNTCTNLKYSAALIDSPKVAIITSGYHLFRAQMLAKRNGLEPILIAAKTPKVIVFSAYIRESMALVKSFLLDR